MVDSSNTSLASLKEFDSFERRVEKLFSEVKLIVFILGGRGIGLSSPRYTLAESRQSPTTGAFPLALLLDLLDFELGYLLSW